MDRQLRTWISAGCLAWTAALPAFGADERYRIDAQHTFSTFEYEHWGLSLQRGRFNDTSGVILLDPVTRAGSIDIEIATGSVSTGSALFDGILRSEEFFNAAAYPKIVFHSRRLQFEGERLVRVDGLLGIKGIARNVTLEMNRFDCRFMLMYGRKACGANGTARLSRSDFELGRYVPFVSDAITLYISVEAIRDDGSGAPVSGAPTAAPAAAPATAPVTTATQ